MAIRRANWQLNNNYLPGWRAPIKLLHVALPIVIGIKCCNFAQQFMTGLEPGYERIGI